MQLELLKIHYRFLAKPNNIVVILAGSEENSSGECEEIQVEIILEKATKEELFALPLSEVREEALERARKLVDRVE